MICAQFLLKMNEDNERNKKSTNICCCDALEVSLKTQLRIVAQLPLKYFKQENEEEKGVPVLCCSPL